MFDFCRFCVVIRFFLSPPQRPMTSDFQGFSIPDFIHNFYFPILILKGLLNLSSLLDDVLLPVLTFWLKSFIGWLKELNCYGYCSNVSNNVWEITKTVHVPFEVGVVWEITKTVYVPFGVGVVWEITKKCVCDIWSWSCMRNNKNCVCDIWS